MIRKLGMKSRQATEMLALRVVGLIHGQKGTDLAMRFYGQIGMRFVGRPAFIAPNAWFDGSQKYSLITLHEGCLISRDVRVLTHDWSPHCVAAGLGRTSDMPLGRLLSVEVGPHAFVGLGAVLMPGTKIGRGAIVGAGAVVRGEVSDYAIVIGNPAHVVGDAREYLQRKFPDEWALLPGQSS